MAQIVARKLRGEMPISNGDYVVLKKEIEPGPYCTTRSIQKVITDTGANIVVEDIHKRTKSKNIPKEYFRPINKDMIEIAMKKRLAQIETDKTIITKVVGNLSDGFDKKTAMTIKDLLNYDEDVGEEEIVSAISGSIAMDSFMSDIAALSSLEID